MPVAFGTCKERADDAIDPSIAPRERKVRVLSGWLAATLALAAASQGAAAPVEPVPVCLVGEYDGSAHEMASRLVLSADGRFGYELSYGALDEGSEGRWRADETAVYLTSDPVAAPKFGIVADAPAPGDDVRISLVLPAGLSAQYFAALVTYADGQRVGRQFDGETLVLEKNNAASPPSAITVMLPLFDVSSEAMSITSGGRDIVIRFDPNDLGKVAFAATPLARGEDALRLERHGRDIVFRQRSGPCLGSRRR